MGTQSTGLRAFAVAGLGVIALLANAIPAVAEADGGRPGVDRAERVIRCLQIDGQKFCTELGFLGDKPSPGSWKEWLEASLAPKATDSGDADLATIVEFLEGLTPKELAARQNEQIAQARAAVGKVRLIDLLASGEPIPPGFFSKYPLLGIAEGTAEAEALRSSSKDASLGQSVAATTGVPYPPYRYIITGYALDDQDRSYWCGPATMQLIDWSNDGGKDSQSYWAGRLDTNANGGSTSIDSIVQRINTDTTWDDLAGPYAKVNIDGQGAQYLQWTMQYNVGLQGAPVVLHPTLRTSFFPYVTRNHGGHFQTGRGYDATYVYFVEPYDEQDFPGGGAASAGYKSVTFSMMYQAIVYTSTPALRTIGY